MPTHMLLQSFICRRIYRMSRIPSFVPIPSVPSSSPLYCRTTRDISSNDITAALSAQPSAVIPQATLGSASPAGCNTTGKVLRTLSCLSPKFLERSARESVSLSATSSMYYTARMTCHLLSPLLPPQQLMTIPRSPLVARLAFVVSEPMPCMKPLSVSW